MLLQWFYANLALCGLRLHLFFVHLMIKYSIGHIFEAYCLLFNNLQD